MQFSVLLPRLRERAILPAQTLSKAITLYANGLMQETLENVDLIIEAGYVLTMQASEPALENHAIALKDDAIAWISPIAESRQQSCDERLMLPDHVVMPGLINAHGHAAMTLLRGYADDLALTPWLEEHIWPAEGSHVSPEFVADGARLAMAEMIRSGTTCFSDMYFFPNVVAQLSADIGLRAQVAAPIFEFPSAWGSGADEYISKALELFDTWKSHKRVDIAFGPHAPYTVSIPTLERIATYAAELDVAVHMHLHETAGEVLAAVEANNERPLDTLRRIGLLGPKTQCVHMTDTGRQDIANLAETGAHVVHCPQSNMKLASGTCPVTALLNAGVNVALGTDGSASNNDLNLFLEMQSAALLAKLNDRDPTSLNADQALHLATMGGAQALGISALTGSLVAGKQADVIAVDLSGPSTQPVYNPSSQLAYACNGSEVTHSWVAGKCLMRDRELTTIDLSATIDRARYWRDIVSSS